jgi:hypothetical protein
LSSLAIKKKENYFFQEKTSHINLQNKTKNTTTKGRKNKLIPSLNAHFVGEKNPKK